MLFKKIINRIFFIFDKNFFHKKAASKHRSFDSMSSVLFWMIRRAKTSFNDFNIDSKDVLEIGSGVFLVHPVIFRILGANNVTTIDIERQFSPKSMKISLEGSIMARKLFSDFIDHDIFIKRYEEIKNNYSQEKLKEAHINYIAPISVGDYYKNNNKKFDIIFSYTVLEHVSQNEIPKLLNESLDLVKPGGFVLHFVDLEDHENPIKDPFKFLSEYSWSASSSSKRGNRLRFSEWKRLFMSYDNFDFQFPFVQIRNDASLPDSISSNVKYKDEQDLRTTKFIVVGKKREDHEQIL